MVLVVLQAYAELDRGRGARPAPDFYRSPVEDLLNLGVIPCEEPLVEV